MKRLIIFLSIITFFVSCEQDESVQLPIKYVDLKDTPASQDQSFGLDIDGDGDTEFLFTTRLTADQSGDQLQFIITPSQANQVFELSKRVGVLESGQEIAPGNPFDKSLEPMAVKLITNEGTTWIGDWKEANNKFIGIRFTLLDQKYYYGWIRVSFNQTHEQFVIHDFAYRTSLNVGIKAGFK